VARSSDQDAFRRWASRWLETIVRLRGAALFPGAADPTPGVAREHGFATWLAFAAHVDGLTQPSSSVALFESAVDAIVAGDEAALSGLLQSFLLDRGANPAMTDDAGQTPLHWATFGPHVDATRALLAKGAPVAARDRRFQATPLDWMVHAWATTTTSEARIRGCEVAALLVRAGAVPDLERFDPTVRARVDADAAMKQALGLSR
jgi:hypothetical protein